MKDAAAIRSMFASIARRYDLLNHLLSFNQDKRWRRKTVEATCTGTEKLALDVCSGTADLAIAYAERLRSDSMVVGTDFTPEMLVFGRAKLEGPRAKGEARNTKDEERRTKDEIGRGKDVGQTAKKNVHLLAADTLRLPFADSLFDIVSVAFGIRNVSDLKGGVREMARVTRGGGKVAILEFSVPENRFFNRMYLFYFTKLLPRIGRMVSRAGNDAYSYLPASVLRFPTRAEMAAVMRECDLGAISATSFTFGIVTLYVGKKQ
jgi:demethylmenaquinone methyltransferase/2-methoxy-6-polyprenyl-1,4-benzoquinol methylase